MVHPLRIGNHKPHETRARAAHWRIVPHDELRGCVGERHCVRRAENPVLQVAGDFDEITDVRDSGTAVDGERQIVLTTVWLDAPPGQLAGGCRSEWVKPEGV